EGEGIRTAGECGYFPVGRPGGKRVRFRSSSEPLASSTSHIQEPQVAVCDYGIAVPVGSNGDLRFCTIYVGKPSQSRHIEDAMGGLRSIEKIHSCCEDGCRK